MLRTIVLVLIGMVASASAQSQGGFLRFSGPLEAIQDEGRRVLLEVSLAGTRVAVELDEHTTITGSLGGRTSSRSLVRGSYLELQGWLQANGVLRATDVQIKVQSGAVRMTGRIENVVTSATGSSIIVNGAEFAIDAQTAVVTQKDGIGVSGSIADLKIGSDVDVTGTYLNENGLGPATAGLFHADRILVSRTFRIQGVLRSRTPATGVPTVIVVHGIVVTLTPETSIAANGLNERNEAFMPRESPVVFGIEDDAGNPCQNTPNEPNACPDAQPKDQSAAGDLTLGSYVRVEGILEDTGFSSRYTARAVQVEKPRQVRFQAVVESRTATSLAVRIGESFRTPVAIDRLTQIEGDPVAGRQIEVAAQFDAEGALQARRIKVLP